MGTTRKEKKTPGQTEDLQLRLDEALDTLRAIRSGEVDALVVSTPEGDRVYTLKGADQVYRIILETLNEGVLTVTPEGHILYGNGRFAEMLKKPLEKVIGSSIFDYLTAEDQSAFRAILDQDREENNRREISLRTGEGTFLPVQVSTNPLKLDGTSAFCLTAVDLTQQKRTEEALQQAHDELEQRVAARTEELGQANEKLQAEVTERKQMEEALRESEARFKLLSETAGQLLATDNPQGKINELCRTVMEFLDCQVFFNFLADEQTGKLHLNACAGIPEGEVRKIEWLDYGVAVCGCVARDEWHCRRKHRRHP